MVARKQLQTATFFIDCLHLFTSFAVLIFSFSGAKKNGILSMVREIENWGAPLYTALILHPDVLFDLWGRCTQIQARPSFCLRVVGGFLWEKTGKSRGDLGRSEGMKRIPNPPRPYSCNLLYNPFFLSFHHKSIRSPVCLWSLFDFFSVEMDNLW